MHDTNSKRYFNTEVRAYSHGCIRLEKYMDLAYYLTLPDTTKIPHDSLNTLIRIQKQKQINLTRPVPIFVKYYSVVGTEEGAVVYFDIYRRDEEIGKVLFRR